MESAVLQESNLTIKTLLKLLYNEKVPLFGSDLPAG